MTDYKEYAKHMRENAVKNEQGNIVCSPELWEEIARVLEKAIIPPCKVGDKVCSLIFQKGNIFSHFLEETYVGIHLSNAPDLRGHRRKNYIIVWNENTNSIRHININKIGKTVFLTKEEAELRKRGEQNAQ